MKTVPAKFAESQNKRNAPRFWLAIITTESGENILISDRSMNLFTGLAFTVYPLLLSDPIIGNGFDLLTRRPQISNVSLKFSNRPFRHSTTAPYGKSERLSDVIGDMRYGSVILRLGVGNRVDSFNEMLLCLDGLVADYPVYDDETITFRLTDTLKSLEKKLPANTIESAFTEAPLNNLRKHIPLVFGKFTAYSATAKGNGLAVAVKVNENIGAKWVVSDHVLDAITKDYTQFSNFIEPSELEDSTRSVNDSGYGTATLVLPSLPTNGIFEATTILRPIDNYTGSYTQNVPDNNVTNLRNAFDRDPDSYAEVLDYIDEGTGAFDQRTGRIMLTFGDHYDGNVSENEVGDIIGGITLELFCETINAGLTFLSANAYLYYRQLSGSDKRVTLTDPVVTDNNQQDIAITWAIGTDSSEEGTPSFTAATISPLFSGIIDSTSDGGGGFVNFHCSAVHNMPAGASVTISGTTDYDGTYVITTSTTLIFNVEVTWVDSQSGTYVSGSVTSGTDDLSITGNYAGLEDTTLTIRIEKAAAGLIDATVSSGGRTRITTNESHGLDSGDAVYITGTTNYNGHHEIVAAWDSQFIIETTYVSDQSGYWGSARFSLDPGTSSIRSLNASAVRGTTSIGYGLSVAFSGSLVRNIGDEWEIALIGQTNLRQHFVWHLRTHANQETDDSFPLALYMEFVTDTNEGLAAEYQGDGVTLNETLIKVYDVRFKVRHRIREVNNLFVSCQGREYGSWITGRGSAYSDGNVITDPAGIIESILRDDLGISGSSIDLPSFITAENTNIEARLNLHSDNRLLASDAIRMLAEQSTFAFIPLADGTYRLADLETTPGSVDRTIPFVHLTGVPICSQSKRLINHLEVKSRWLEERQEFADYDEYDDTTSQGKYGTWTQAVKWPNINGSSASTIANWLINATDGLLSTSHETINFKTFGVTQADLEPGDWIDLEDGPLDGRLLLQGATWSGTKFVIIDTKQSKKETAIKAVRLNIS